MTSAVHRHPEVSGAGPVVSAAAAYRVCARITRRNGTTYYWGTQLLPRAQRRHVHAVYALCRRADDIVDAPGATDPARVADTARRLGALVNTVEALRAGRITTADPVLTAAVLTVQECAIDPGCLRRFFGAMAQDLTVTTYRTWEDLLGYMDGSAAVIGEMLLPVLRPTDARATGPARALGLAFQLTNFLRDVGEDLDRGRVYLPQEDLERFGADPGRRRADPSWQAVMAFEVQRNRELYAEADAGIDLLPPASARCVRTARTLYARILNRIEAADYDVFSERIRVPTAEKVALTARLALR